MLGSFAFPVLHFCLVVSWFLAAGVLPRANVSCVGKNKFLCWLLFVILAAGCGILVIMAPVDSLLAGVVTLGTFAPSTYQGYAHNRRLHSALSNNYDDCVVTSVQVPLFCSTSSCALALQVQWYYQSARIQDNDSLSNKYHSMWHALAEGAQWVGHSCVTLCPLQSHTCSGLWLLGTVPNSLSTLIDLGYDSRLEMSSI